MLKIKLTDDKAFVKTVQEALRKNDGYCPCRIAKIPDNKCMCKQFREQDYPGECHCGLYEKVEVNMNNKVEVNMNKVEHPSYYTSGKTEVWDFIKEQKLNYFLGNAIKYISRAGKKNKDTYVEDLNKAIVYINKEISNYKEMSGE